MIKHSKGIVMKNYFKYLGLLICIQYSCNDSNALNTDSSFFNEFVKSFTYHKCSIENSSITYRTNINQGKNSYNQMSMIHEECEFDDNRISFISRKSESILSNESLSNLLSFRDIMYQKYLNIDNREISVFKRDGSKVSDLYLHDLYNRIYEDYHDMFLNIEALCNYDDYTIIDNYSLFNCNLNMTYYNFLLEASPEYRLILFKNLYITQTISIDFEDPSVTSFLEREKFIDDDKIRLFKESPCDCENVDFGYWTKTEYSYK